MKVVHIVARANAAKRPFEDSVAAAWAWEHLREAFPCVLAAALMPNHVHLVAAVVDPAAARNRLARMLGRLGIRFAPGVDLWERVPDPKLLGGRKEILTANRYVVLNACHAHLVDDPYAWWWSTLRDGIGAVVDPWVRPQDLAPLLECRPGDVGLRLHEYITRDRTVVPAPCPFPRAADNRLACGVSVDALESAVAAALRIPRERVRERADARQLFVALARAQGWAHGPLLAQALGVDRSTIYRSREVPAQWLSAAMLCLGDRRLSAPLPSPGAAGWSTAAAAGLHPRGSGRAA
jgi:hypothetical protein